MKQQFSYLLALLSLAGWLEAQTPLADTRPLTGNDDFASRMVDGINEYLLKQTGVVASDRKRFWKPDYSSQGAYNKSIERNRADLRRIIGAVDERISPAKLIYESTDPAASPAGRGRGYKIWTVKWPVFEGVFGEGLLLAPDRPPVARFVVLPDADESPESMAGLEPGVDTTSQIARRLAESGCQVLVPVLIDRKDTWSGIPAFRMTNQPHREWIYRMAFEAGRHIIGYEVEKVLAAIDSFASEPRAAPIGVAGYGEGGLIALYAAALDTRIDAALVSGYFGPREGLWHEPIYRDLWGLLREFGDAEIAAMVAPRSLLIEAARVPNVKGPPAPTKERMGACPNGSLYTPSLELVRSEVERARSAFTALGAADKLQLIASGNGDGAPRSQAALSAILSAVGIKMRPASAGAPPELLRSEADPARMHRQFDQLVDYTQRLLAQAPARRAQFWAKADSSSPQRWSETSQFYRDYVWDEVIGRLPPPALPANPRTRQIYDEPRFRGYEVLLDVWPGVFAYGILLVPKDLKQGERRPLVVCQHGLEGRPQDVTDPRVDSPYYHHYAATLTEQGYITYAPQNPYIGQDRFRVIQRKAHPLKLALFSFILGQHQQTIKWLSSLPFVDPQRIGFYGLSYGGKTAVRVPPLLPQYALSICSADFNEWVWKNTSITSRYSYLLTGEYDMIEFDFANVVNYGELAMLMAPRPFMVERGHFDGVAPDEWVAYEFAKVRRFYVTQMKLPDNAEIEFFNGPHTINGKGTFEFLRRHLKWPE